MSPAECGGHTKQVTRKAAHCGWGGDAYFNQPNSTYQKSSGLWIQWYLVKESLVSRSAMPPPSSFRGVRSGPCPSTSSRNQGAAPRASIWPSLPSRRARGPGPGHCGWSAGGLAEAATRLECLGSPGQLWICLCCKIIYLLMLWGDFFLTNYFMSHVLLWLLYAG